MEEKNEYGGGGFTFSQLMWLLKANLLAMAIIIAVAAAVGAGLALTTKTEYTATQSLIVKCVDADGKTTMSTANLNTIAESCRQSPVIESANSIYSPDGSPTPEVLGANMKVWYDVNTQSYYMFVSYMDYSKKEARGKVNALASAIQTTGAEISSEGLSLTVSFMTVDENPVVTEYSAAKKYLLLCILAGLVVAVLYVMIRYLADNSVKSGEELERIAGAKVFAYLEAPSDTGVKKAEVPSDEK